jgi:mRNA-degrading endonuclease RelE of RelBE toxin-antitoxin system
MRYNFSMADSSLSFILLPKFRRDAKSLLNEKQLTALQEYLRNNPKIGDVISGSRGCRKMRWGAEGRGKRGGTRVIYFHQDAQGRIWLMRIYAKNDIEDVDTQELLRLRKEIDLYG